MQNILLDIFFTYIALLVVTGLYGLYCLVLLRYRSRKACLCTRCGRSERMKPYGHESRIQTRTSYLLYCGILPGILYYIWTSRFYLCPHCLNVASSAELHGRQLAVATPPKRRRRRSRSSDPR
jgi:hypothetical protein